MALKISGSINSEKLIFLESLGLLLPSLLSKLLVISLMVHTQIIFSIFSINDNISFYPNHSCKSHRMTKLNNDEKLMNLGGLGLLLLSLSPESAHSR